MDERSKISGGKSFSRFLALLFLLMLCASGCQYVKDDAAPRKLTNPCIVLALPASGPYAAISAKIRKGAELAAESLKGSGTMVRLENVNTESPDWLRTLEALPPQCVTVGGPLRDKAYLEAKKSGELEKKIFFSFVPTLSSGDEGKIAWRFFPSQQDQINALVKLGLNDLNIRSYAAFHPEDAYGKRMTDLFAQTLAAKHVPVARASYNPSAPGSWSDAAAVLIRPSMAEDGKTPIPQSNFEAIFLPDSWKHMDMLMQSLMYNGEDRLVMMGTNLWEQGVAGKQIARPQRYALAVFPGAWDSRRAPKALQGAGNDFWVALGYDFLNFAVNLGLDKRVPAAQVAANAQRASSIIRAIAPLRWNNMGEASESLYLFQIGPNGISPLDLEKLRQARTEAGERAVLRLQGIRDSEPEMPMQQPVQGTEPAPVEPLARPVAEDPVAAPAQPPVQAPVLPGNLSTTPQPSYKLRLPGQK